MPTSVAGPGAWGLAVGLLAVAAGYNATASAEDLLGVYRIALDNDAAYHAAELQYTAAYESIPQARAELLPDVAFQAERIETHQDIRSSDNTVFGSGDTRFPTNNLTLSLTQPLFRYSAWIGYRQAKLAVRQAQVELFVAQQQLIVDVAEAYFDVLAAQDNLEYARSERTAIGKQLELAESRTRTGIARVTDLYDAEARHALAESREIEAENVLDDAYRGLQEHTRQLITAIAPVRDEMPLTSPEPADPGQWIESALTQNLTLEARKQALEVIRAEIRRQGAEHYPTLDFVASHNQRDTQGSLFGGGSEVDTTDYMLRFILPLYQGGGVRSRRIEAEIVHQASIQEYEVERRRVERETRAAYLGVLSGIKRVQALKQSIESQNSALEVKTAGLRAGVNTMLEVLDAQRDLYFVQADYSRARYDYLLSTLKLKQATGDLSIADLEEINRLIE